MEQEHPVEIKSSISSSSSMSVERNSTPTLEVDGKRCNASWTISSVFVFMSSVSLSSLPKSASRSIPHTLPVLVVLNIGLFCFI